MFNVVVFIVFNFLRVKFERFNRVVECELYEELRWEKCEISGDV